MKCVLSAPLIYKNHSPKCILRAVKQPKTVVPGRHRANPKLNLLSSERAVVVYLCLSAKNTGKIHAAARLSLALSERERTYQRRASLLMSSAASPPICDLLCLRFHPPRPFITAALVLPLAENTHTQQPREGEIGTPS